MRFVPKALLFVCCTITFCGRWRRSVLSVSKTLQLFASACLKISIARETVWPKSPSYFSFSSDTEPRLLSIFAVFLATSCFMTRSAIALNGVICTFFQLLALFVDSLVFLGVALYGLLNRGSLTLLDIAVL